MLFGVGSLYIDLFMIMFLDHVKACGKPLEIAFVMVMQYQYLFRCDLNLSILVQVPLVY